MVAARRERVDGALTQFVLFGIQPRKRLFRGEAIIGQKRQRTLQERERFPAVRTLDEDFLRNTAHSVVCARLDQDTVTDQLLEATLLDAEETAHLVGGQHGDISTGHERKITPFMRRTDTHTSRIFAKTLIESTK